MSSELEKLVDELRAVAAEAEKLRPQLIRHAERVRDFAAEIAADPEEGRSMGHTQAASLLQQASRQCDELAAELGLAKIAADHFAGRVLSGGGAGSVDKATPPPRATPVPAAEPAGERGHGSETGPLPTAAAPPEAPSAAPPGRATEPPGVDTPPPTDTDKPPLPPYVPWWIPNGAPWHGHRGISPRRAPDGSPLTEFTIDDLTKPVAIGTKRVGGGGGNHDDHDCDGDDDDHDGDGVPPSRVAIADPSRDLVTAFVEAGYTSPDCLPRGLVEERSFWLDQCGHAALRHAEIPDSALMERAMFGWDPITGNTSDWEKKNSTHKYGRDATSFRTRADLIFAEAHVWTSAEAAQARAKAEQNGVLRFRVTISAARIYGPDLNKHLKGWTRIGSQQYPTGITPTIFGTDTFLKLAYRRDSVTSPWYPVTAYPNN